MYSHKKLAVDKVDDHSYSVKCFKRTIFVQHRQKTRLVSLHCVRGSWAHLAQQSLETLAINIRRFCHIPRETRHQLHKQM